LKKFVNASLVIAAAIFFVIGAGNMNTANAREMKSIIDLAVENGHFNKLVDALYATGIADMLKSGESFTVFAPVDDAFSTMTPQQINELLTNKDELKKVLLYHLAMGEKLFSQFKCGQRVETLLGKSVKIKKDGSDVKVNDANVIQVDVLGYNGVIHIIDRVNIPSDRQSYKEPMKDCE
jgi:uncharacterized surface protein with fasciclin (FAS1) repeats